MSKVLDREMTDNLYKAGQKVKVNILNKDTYTEDLYKAIQGEIGVIIKPSQSPLSPESYLVRFGKKAQNKYAKTHSGKWGGAGEREDFEWWTEPKNFNEVR